MTWNGRGGRPGDARTRTHLVGADGDVGAVEEGVALDEVVGGERVRGEGLAAGDGGVVRADVEAVAQAEEVVRRRGHALPSVSAAGHALALAGRDPRRRWIEGWSAGALLGPRARSWEDGGSEEEVRISSRQGAAGVTLLNVEKATYSWWPHVHACVPVDKWRRRDDRREIGSSQVWSCSKISGGPKNLSHE